MEDIVFGLVSFILAAGAFGFGAAKLFKKKKPMYFQLIVCAAGCFAIEQLSVTVNIWCGVYDALSIGMLGIFGCNFFLLSANYGTLDRIVDDGKGSKKARILALIAPVIMAVLIGSVFTVWWGSNKTGAVMWTVMLIPALFASYFNLKHLLLPMDPYEFLRATKPCNIAALVFCIVTAAYAIMLPLGSNVISGTISIAASASMLLLAIFSVKGAKKWGI